MYRKSLLLGVVLGGGAAGLTIALPHFMTLNPVLFVLLLPGVLASIAAAGHVHSYRSWVAALVNGFLWFALSAMLGVMFQWSLKVLGRRRQRRPIEDSDAPRREVGRRSGGGRSGPE